MRRTMPRELSVFGLARATKELNTSGMELPAAMSVAPGGVQWVWSQQRVVCRSPVATVAPSCVVWSLTVHVVREVELLAQDEQ
jgi:hypothetical protein